MIVAKQYKLYEFATKHPNAQSTLDNWLLVVKAAEWKTPVDIKRKFAAASFLHKNKVVFNIGGNKFRLVVVVAYFEGVVRVEWVGTHQEYSKLKFE